jgi:hypothetical protein
MKRGNEITPDEEYRLRGEDLYESGGPGFGVKGGSNGSSIASTASSSN